MLGYGTRIEPSITLSHLTLGKFAHHWIMIARQGSSDAAMMTTTYSKQGGGPGVSRVRYQCRQSQAGKANESCRIPENSELIMYLPYLVFSWTREPHWIIHKHLDQLRETRVWKRKDLQWLIKQWTPYFNYSQGHIMLLILEMRLWRNLCQYDGKKWVKVDWYYQHLSGGGFHLTENAIGHCET